MSGNNNPAQRITVDLGEKEAEGIYSNLTLITHSSAEFILDFARLVPGVPKAKVHARVILTPQSAKALAAACWTPTSSAARRPTGRSSWRGQPSSGHNIGFQTE